MQIACNTVQSISTDFSNDSSILTTSELKHIENSLQDIDISDIFPKTLPSSSKGNNLGIVEGDDPENTSLGKDGNKENNLLLNDHVFESPTILSHATENCDPAKEFSRISQRTLKRCNSTILAEITEEIGNKNLTILERMTSNELTMNLPTTYLPTQTTEIIKKNLKRNDNDKSGTSVCEEFSEISDHLLNNDEPLACSSQINSSNLPDTDDSIRDPDYVLIETTNKSSTLSTPEISTHQIIYNSEESQNRKLSYFSSNDVLGFSSNSSDVMPNIDVEASTDKEYRAFNGTCNAESEDGEESHNYQVSLQPLDKGDKIKIYDKIHICYFCSKSNQKMSRHLTQCHSNEIIVSKLMSLSKLSTERRNGFIELAKAGDFYHNIEVLRTNSGSLIVARRQPNMNDYRQYTPCPECLGFYIKKNLWVHMRHCNKLLETGLLNKRDIQSSSSSFLSIFVSDSCPEFNSNIISRMTNDKISEICKSDKLILLFGIQLFQKFGTTQNELIRQEMRRLSRLVLHARSTSKLTTLEELITPTKFDLVITSVKEMCGEIIPTDTLNRPAFHVPSLALKLRQSLKKCVYILRAQHLKNNRILKEREVKAFGTLIEMEWATKISSQACSTLNTRKMNKPDMLPLTEDLIKLMKFQSERIKVLSETLKNSNNGQIWKSLAEVVLSRIILFNKRRSGEASKLLLKEYVNRPNWNSEITGELEQSLSLTEKKLASSMTLIQTRGKRGRTVPVLISNEVKTAMDLLIAKRDNCGVMKSNPFIFARVYTTSITHLRGCDCLREVSEMAALQKPELVRATKLRKYVATVCQLFDMKEFELEWLSNHLGHSVTVHRNFYRLRESAVELAKMSKLLITVESGNVGKYAGKNLEEITLSGEDITHFISLLRIPECLIYSCRKLFQRNHLCFSNLDISTQCIFILNILDLSEVKQFIPL